MAGAHRRNVLRRAGHGHLRCGAVNGRFEDLSTQAQVHRMRRVAASALEQYPIDVVRFRLLLHGFNTSFRVDTRTGERFALRINLNVESPADKLDVEMAWMAALDDETDVVLPRPVATTDGRLHTTARSDDLDRELPVVLMTWLPGRDLGSADPETTRALGALTATLHDHAEGWAPPHRDALPDLGDVLVGMRNRYLDTPFLTDEQRAVITAAHERAQAANDRAIASAGAIVLHADLHPDNLKWFRRRLAVFDFDDIGLGAPVQDLAIASYYLSSDDEGTRDDLQAGYETVRPLPVVDDGDFEAMRAGRNVLLLNDVLDVATADVIAIRERYAANSVLKLRAFLETGRYRHDVPGVVPLDG